jgi:hypothetical protein
MLSYGSASSAVMPYRAILHIPSAAHFSSAGAIHVSDSISSSITIETAVVADLSARVILQPPA